MVADFARVFYVLDGAGGLNLSATGRVLVAWCGFAWVPALILMTVFLPRVFHRVGRRDGAGGWSERSAWQRWACGSSPWGSMR